MRNKSDGFETLRRKVILKTRLSYKTNEIVGQLTYRNLRTSF